MYGSIRPDPSHKGANILDLECGGATESVSMSHDATVASRANTTNKVEISWELVLLLSAQFLLFGLGLMPLIPNNESATDAKNFWKSYSLVAVAACLPYVLLTVPIAVGYHWFLKSKRVNFLVWFVIIATLAFVCHVASVRTDSRGVFVGCCSLSIFLLLMSINIAFHLIDMNLDSYLLFALCTMWPIGIFIPVYFLKGLPLFSACGSCVATILASVFLLSELRMIENRTSIVTVALDNERQTSGIQNGKNISRASITDAEISDSVTNLGGDDLVNRVSPSSNTKIPPPTPQRIDSFTLAIWVNCSTWKFLIQLLILVEKTVFHSICMFFQILVWIWKKTITLFASKTPTEWVTPPTIKKVVGV